MMLPTMLPAAPKTLGRLSDVFISALGSISGEDNRLGLAKASRACVILVDGLGSENLRKAAGHAPFLNSILKNSKSINTVFPSTTAAAITSFGTAVRPGEHGILSYSVFDRQSNQTRNMLTGWGKDMDPRNFQPCQTVATRAKESDIAVFTIGPSEYEGSGFTQLNMLGSIYVAAKTFDDRVQAVKKILSNKAKSLTYLYFPELDSIAHAQGVGSIVWLNKLEELDLAVRKMSADLPADVGILLTADHGVIDVPKENQILLDELPLPGLLQTTGDPRNIFLYFEPETNLISTRTALEKFLGDRAIVASAIEVVEAGWFGTGRIHNEQFLPDLFILSNANYACYHRQFAKPQSLRMIGQHGGISQIELSVPLLKLGAFKD